MFINYEMATIEITKTEAKEAGVFKSEMYENLKEAREATGYKVVVKDTKRKADTMKGLRISDILSLRLSDIVRDGDRYRLEITEQKTKKKRVFTVPLVIQQYIENYCLRNGIGKNEKIFDLTERAISKQLALVCDYLGFEGIGTHSFRKWYATEIYKNNGYDITLVQRLLQHSSASITQRYIGIEPQRIEEAIEGHAQLL